MEHEDPPERQLVKSGPGEIVRSSSGLIARGLADWRAQTLRTQAREAERVGDWPAAIAAWRELLELKPGDYTAWNLLGCMYQWNKQFAEACTAHRESLRLTPTSCASQLNVSIALSSMGEYSAALDSAKAVLQLRSDCWKAWCVIGEISHRVGGHLGFLPPGASLLCQHPDVSQYESQGQPSSLLPENGFAVERWREWWDRSASNLEYCEELWPKLPPRPFENALYLLPGDGDAWLGLVEAHPKEAIPGKPGSGCRHGLEAPRDLARCWNGRGLSRSHGDDIVGAYSEALRLTPADGQVWVNLALGYMAGCLHQEAVDTLRRALQFYPGDGDLWKCLGEELTELDGPCDDAVDAYRMATVLFPNDIYYWGVLGHAYSRAGRSEEAIAAHRKVIQLAEDCGHKGRIVTAWCDLGHTYMAAHRFREALDAYDTAMKMETQESAPWEGMLRLFLEIGRVEEALALCRLARRLFPDQYVFVYWLKTLETEAAKLHAGPLTSRQKPIAPSDNTCNGGSSRSQKASRPAQGDLFHDDASSEETA